jgi:hypothetical protein
MTSSYYSIIPKTTFTIVDFNTKRRTVLDSDGNLISTDIDPENIEFELEPKNNLDLKMNDLKLKLKENSEDLKLRNLVFLSKLIYP